MVMAPLEDTTTPAALLARQQADLPEVLDVLIVGAGPAGTAAALRARELGLSPLVIDRDQILGILRDWMTPDDKRVDSSYGPGGRRVPFPRGGDLVEKLTYGDQVASSELYNKWMRLYLDNNIPARAEVELLKLTRRDDGIWVATCLDLRSREEQEHRARAVILALGRGVPTKLDIPGDLGGIDCKLRGADKFVGRPACVIGGGTSAAEAVIAISEAKARAGDGTDIFWSYRRKNLPKVNATLAEKFFTAYAGNGNIKYLPISQPLAVLKRPDGEDFLGLRSDRLEMPGRPPQATFLEFSKAQVLACIGADIPVDFLQALGIGRLTSADGDEKLMAVTPLYESALPNVFLIGDLLASAYIQTTDFSPDALQSTVIDHVGNFKSGMTDGVLAIEIIAQRLRHKQPDEKIAKLLEEKRAEYREAHKQRLEVEKEKEKKVPAAAPPPKEPESPRIGATFVLLIKENGEDKELQDQFLTTGRFVVGHDQGDLCFPEDDGIVNDHAALVVEPDACYVSSEGMQKERDTWVDVRSERTVPVNSIIAAGRQRLRVATSEDQGWLLAVLDADGEPRSHLPVYEEDKIYGRTQTNTGIAIDPDDLQLSRRHFSFSAQGGVFRLRDWGSTNRTFLKVMGAVRLNEGDVVVVGNTRMLFKNLETGGAQLTSTVIVPPSAEPQPTVAEPPPVEVPKAPLRPSGDGAPGTMVLPAGETLPLDKEKVLLTQFQEKGLATKHRSNIGGKCQSLYDCERGDCGLCILKVLRGGELLSKQEGKEKRTLRQMVRTLVEDQGRDLDAKDCRLACKAKLEGDGSLEVELLGNTDAGD